MKIIKEVLPPNAPQAARDAQSNASSEVSSVEGKIGHITINVAGQEQAKNLVVTVDGAPISAVLIGSPVPIDPGDHVVEGVATGLRGKTTIGVAAGQRQEVALKLEADASAVPPVAAAAAVAPAAQPQQPPPVTPPETTATPPAADQGQSNGTNGLRIGSYVAFGVGAVGVVGGTVFMLQSSSKRSDADKLCNLPGGACPVSSKDQVNSLDSEANKARTLGIVGFALGAAGIGAGVTLLVLSMGHAEKAMSVAPWVGVNTAGVRGSF
jgi:hypothetical protein